MSGNVEQENGERKKLIPVVYIVGAVLLVVLIGAAIIAGVIWLASNYAAELEAVRDVFIIGLALQSCLFGFVLLIMLTMLIRLVNTLEFEIKPILKQTNETIGNVRGTTAFVSRNLVKPVTNATSAIAGIRRGLKALVGNPRDNLSD